MTTETMTVDLKMTWGDFGAIYKRLAMSKETKGLAVLSEDFSKAMAAAQALQTILHSLTDEQTQAVGRTITAELQKQGF